MHALTAFTPPFLAAFQARMLFCPQSSVQLSLELLFAEGLEEVLLPLVGLEGVPDALLAGVARPAAPAVAVGAEAAARVALDGVEQRRRRAEARVLPALEPVLGVGGAPPLLSTFVRCTHGCVEGVVCESETNGNQISRKQ